MLGFRWDFGGSLGAHWFKWLVISSCNLSRTFLACWVAMISWNYSNCSCAKDKDDLKARLNKLQGDTTGRAVAPDAEFRHSDMESAHQHILYLETKVRAMEELDPCAASLAGRLA